jgi:hypothetical protein
VSSVRGASVPRDRRGTRRGGATAADELRAASRRNAPLGVGGGTRGVLCGVWLRNAPLGVGGGTRGVLCGVWLRNWPLPVGGGARGVLCGAWLDNMPRGAGRASRGALCWSRGEQSRCDAGARGPVSAMQFAAPRGNPRHPVAKPPVSRSRACSARGSRAGSRRRAGPAARERRAAPSGWTRRRRCRRTA